LHLVAIIPLPNIDCQWMARKDSVRLKLVEAKTTRQTIPSSTCIEQNQGSKRLSENLCPAPGPDITRREQAPA
jgi:hypothetical protein